LLTFEDAGGGGGSCRQTGERPTAPGSYRDRAIAGRSPVGGTQFCAMSSEPLHALRRIRIRDNGEPLVDLLAFSPALRWAAEHPVFTYQRERLCRLRVAQMLAAAQAELPPGIHLEIVEGWRSPSAQRMMYQSTWTQMRQLHPNWSDAALRRLVNRFSAPPDHPVHPPHLTGGAVDLHLVDAAGTRLDLTSPYLLADRRSAAMDAPGLSETTRINRRLLAGALTAVGLTSYAAEWWHWSYGDQGWAYRTGRPEAIYGPVAPGGVAAARQRETRE
jgi:D-alanyl-D-alanine dipeptidase